MNRLFVILKYALFPLIYLALQVPCIAQQNGCHYEVSNGKIKIFNYLLEPRYPVNEDSDITCNNSPDGRWVTIQAGYQSDIDIWLYDSYLKKSPIRIDTDPGNNTRLIFHDNEVFEVRWGGMGYRMSDFFEVDKPKIKVHKDDVLTYFDRLDVYVAFYEDGIQIGKIFGKGTPEKFHVNFDLTDDPSAISPLFVIDKVRIQGENLILSRHKANSNSITEIFSPKVLKGNTEQLEHDIE